MGILDTVFTNGDAKAGAPPTQIPAQWLNAVGSTVNLFGFAQAEQAIPDLTINVEAGRFLYRDQQIISADQDPLFDPSSIPVGEERVDLVVCDLIGNIQIIEGVASVAPAVVPDIALVERDLPICRVILQNGQTEILAANITDLRPLFRSDDAGTRDLVSLSAVRNYSVDAAFGSSANWSVAWSPELMLFVACAHNGPNRMQYSKDGKNWQTGVGPASSIRASDVIWIPELSLFFVSADAGGGPGGAGHGAYSSDGQNWTQASMPAANADWRAVTWSPELGLAVVVSDDGQVATSTDGMTFVSGTPASIIGWEAITWSPKLGMFVAVAFSGAGDRIMTSTDGLSWVLQTPPIVALWSDIVWAQELSLFVAVDAGGAGVMTSSNGTAWDLQTVSDPNGWGAIEWCPEIGQLIAVASSGVNRVMSSKDGKNWLGHGGAADATLWDDIVWSPQLLRWIAGSWLDDLLLVSM